MAGNSSDTITISNAVIREDTIWSDDIVIIGDVQVLEGAVLTISADSEVISKGTFTISGTLIIKGFLENTGTLNISGSMVTQGQLVNGGALNYGEVIDSSATESTDTIAESTIVRTSSQQTVFVGYDPLVNSYIDNSQYAPDIAALNNGNYANFWQTSGMNIGDAYLYVFGQILDSSANKIGSEIQLDKTLIGDNPLVTTLSNETFIVSWRGANYHDFQGQIFNEDGSKSGEIFQITSDSSLSYSNLNLTELSNGNISVSYNSSKFDSGEYTHYISQKILNSDGSVLTDEKVLWESDGSSRSFISSLTDGKFITAWYEDENFVGQIFDQNNNEIGSKFVIYETDASEMHYSGHYSHNTGFQAISITALPNGNIAVLGLDGDYTDYIETLLIFSDQGVRLTDPVIIDVEGANETDNSLNLMNDDNLLFTWLDNNVGSVGRYHDTLLRGILYDLDGNLIDDNLRFEIPTNLTGIEFTSRDVFVSEDNYISTTGVDYPRDTTGGNYSDISTLLYKLNSQSEGDLTIVGNVIEGETLSISNSITDTDGINSSSISYQWIWEHPTLGKFDINGETSSEYVLHSSDVGSKISVRYTFTDNNGTVETVNGIATATIANNAATVTDTTGDDIVTGTAYADTIGAGIGRDVVDAAAGDDTITLTAATASSTFILWDGKFAHNVGSTTQVATDVRINLSGRVKLETVVDGGAGADTVNLSSSDDAFFLHDSFSGFHSSLTLTTDTHTGGQSTQRILNVETINGLGGDDIIDLTSPDYSLAGQVITINGGAGNDVIWGSDATETLIGGDGNDILFGGSGNDTLTGGSGNDVFEFTRTAGSDTITDFQSGTDTIKLYIDYTFDVSKTASTTADYSIDDQSDPILYLARGKTYTFEMSGNGHPFYIKSTSSTSGTSDEYTDGVTRIGSANSGNDGDKLQFIATAETPDMLWYQCSAHSGMLGQLNIVDKLSDTIQTSGNNLIWNTLTIQSDTAFDLDDVSFVAIA